MNTMIRTAILASMMLLASSFLYAYNPETTMAPISAKGGKLITYLEDELHLEIVRVEYDILRDKKTTSRYLQSGWTYSIIAFGDYRFRDIDVKVYRKYGDQWYIEEKDSDSDSMAVVTITPSTTAEYLIEISAYSFEPGYNVGHYGLVIAHE